MNRICTACHVRPWRHYATCACATKLCDECFSTDLNREICTVCGQKKLYCVSYLQVRSLLEDDQYLYQYLQDKNPTLQHSLFPNRTNRKIKK